MEGGKIRSLDEGAWGGSVFGGVCDSWVSASGEGMFNIIYYIIY